MTSVRINIHHIHSDSYSGQLERQKPYELEYKVLVLPSEKPLPNGKPYWKALLKVEDEFVIPEV